jgi:hypothetical protein
MIVNPFREQKNDPYKAQKCGGGLRPPPHFWAFLASPLQAITDRKKC